MMTIPPYRLFPLGDQAITVDFGNVIDEQLNDWVLSLYCDLLAHPPAGMIEAVPAYSSLTIYYDLVVIRPQLPIGTTGIHFMQQQIRQRLDQVVALNPIAPRLLEIPVCYDEEMSPDLVAIAKQVQLSEEEVIQIFQSISYRVFMMGFLPGFAYMGTIDQRLQMPRKPRPVNVPAGSIGIAGLQTGIYPLASPGGWQIIGRTPISLFDIRRADSVYLKAGDIVRFTSISKHEFANY